MRRLLIGGLALGLLTGCSTAAAPAYTERTVSLANGADRPLPTLILQPTTPGRRPVVLFSHGYTRLPADYHSLLAAWARAGFLVVAPAFPHSARGAATLDDQDIVNQPGDDTAVLTAVLALDNTRGDPLFARINIAQIAAAGHSLGGMTTIGLLTKHRDPRLKAAVVLAGGQWPFGTGYTGDPAPVLFVHGRADDVVKFEGSTEAYDPLPWPKALLALPDGDHLTPYLGPGPDADAVARTTTDFLRWTLAGDRDARARLPTDASAAGTLDDHLG